MSVLLFGCDPNAGFVGTWNGATTLTSASRTVTKTGVVSVGTAAAGVLVTIQMPLPTMDMPTLSTACAIPATATSGDTLTLSPLDCPTVHVGGGCSVTLKVATAKGVLQQPTILKINGSGTVLGAGCGTSGTSTDSFSFETLVNK